MNRIPYQDALDALQVLARLAEYDPHVAGTPPLGIDGPESDIDVLCHAPDLEAFAGTLVREFGGEADFSLRRWGRDPDAVIAGFKACGWEFEIFGQGIPVERQAGWRHFIVERRLLQMGGPDFRAAVMARRAGGMKTEPAFSSVLGLAGDPYQAMVDLDGMDEEMMGQLLQRVW